MVIGYTDSKKRFRLLSSKDKKIEFTKKQIDKLSEPVSQNHYNMEHRNRMLIEEKKKLANLRSQQEYKKDYPIKKLEVRELLETKKNILDRLLKNKQSGGKNIHKDRLYYYNQKLVEIDGEIAKRQRIPRLYETDSKPVERKTIYQKWTNHKKPGTYWLIAEMNPEQKLAFGFVNHNDALNANWSYISMRELESHGAVPDVNWKPVSFAEAKKLL